MSLNSLPRSVMGGVRATTGDLDPALIQYASGSLTNAQVKALRATPQTLVAAQGPGTVIEPVSLWLFFDYTAAYTESDDNLKLRYTDGSGTDLFGSIEATGFVDATADTAIYANNIGNGSLAQGSALAKTACDNQPVVLHNAGDGEYGAGNAANLIRYKIAYRVLAAGW
jgi:hypothetical protein